MFWFAIIRAYTRVLVLHGLKLGATERILVKESFLIYNKSGPGPVEYRVTH